MRSLILLLLLGHLGVQSLSTTINKKVGIGNNNFQCTFVLKHTAKKVNVKKSSVNCSPKTPRKQFANLALTSDEHNFFGKIKVNPSRIISMNVEARTTAEIQGANNQSLGQEEFESEQPHQATCGTDDIDENTNKTGNRWTYLKPLKFWADAIVPWSFVAASDDISTDSVHTDSNVGLSNQDFETVQSAMRQIEAKTCIKFKLDKPIRHKPWLFITRDANAFNQSCQRAYISDKLQGKNISGLGDIYGSLSKRPNCSAGAYARYGSNSPQILVIGALNDMQVTTGLIIHELMHNLGIGHTQKRQDAYKYIKILYENIAKEGHSQYTPCLAQNNTKCSRYNDYGTPYDCMSIMHYRDNYFLTEEAWKNGGKSMKPIKKGCDLSADNFELTNSDVSLMNKMYCVNKVDGSWGEWSGFSSCSNDKGGMPVCKRKKVRSCDDPAPTNGGNQCSGESEMFENCIPEQIDPTNNPNCVLTGGWSVWSEASTCSASCSSTRTRTCTNPKPFNSDECEGEAIETSTCTGGDCGPRTIKSPNYPEDYPNNENVSFPLEVDPGSRIKLSFIAFDLEFVSDCRWDYVKVLDTDGITELAKLCGSSLPPTISSSGNKMTVFFSSDYVVTNKGFLATWSEVSEATSGVITSPNYPHFYANNVDQEDKIFVPTGKTIFLTITDFSIACGGGDRLKIFDGPSQSAKTLLDVCGWTKPDPIVSTGNAMTVVFESDAAIGWGGFKATWKEI